MFTFTPILRRRRGHGHVVKYLEGVPTPSKLIDHLAGANLHASAELPFFNTVPRYVDVQQEQRLSRLFFHHVLYPAGGARLPYQAVVVRNGRAVQPCIPRLCRLGGGTDTSIEGKKQAPSMSVTPAAVVRGRDSLKAPTARPNPLAVPTAQLSAASSPPSSLAPAHAPLRSDYGVSASSWSAAAWARVDPARRPYFTTCVEARAAAAPRPPSPYRNVHAEYGPTATFARHARSHASALTAPREDSTRTSRAVEDDVLTPLRGVLEQYWTGSPAEPAAQRVRDSLVAPCAGLLQRKSAAMQSSTTTSLHTTFTWDGFLEHLQHSVADALASEHAHGTPRPPSFVRSYAYVQTRLPPVATVALPLEEHDTLSPSRVQAPAQRKADSKEFLCRMAGGVEPVVPFAVGRLLTRASSSSSSSTSPSLSDQLFPHVTCLTRLNLRVPVTPISAKAAPLHTVAKQQHIGEEKEKDSSHSVSTKRASERATSMAESWRLGDGGLDLMVPHHARTVAEKHPTKPSATAATASSSAPPHRAGRYVVGRADAETYLLPQRELLLTLHVPQRTEAMCAAQNQERLRRQVRLGRAGQAAMAWSTEHTRLTAARRALGQFANTESAASTGLRQPESTPGKQSSGASQTASAPAPGPAGATITSRITYEVRALPGDVVYIPRGWGYDVQRIIGTATFHKEHGAAWNRTAGGDRRTGGEPAQQRSEFRDHRALSGGRAGRISPVHRPSHAVPEKEEKGEATNREAKAVTDAAAITSVDVDAFCLHYRPYPELTEAQAAVYVAANYVHGGVEEFYEKGGSDVFRSYV